ncbi:MAG: DUF1207 domain-containing protein, partial [Ignavibacteriaceae bacterium]|nr:DUF1207 domain-containing protein [Ignavibacteriaceae bacterium]
FDLRVYGGLTYNIHIVPDEIKKEIFQVGFDYYPDILSTSVFTPFVAYDFKLTGIDQYTRQKCARRIL